MVRSPKGADLNDEQVSQILNFLKIKDLKELKETLKNPLSQEGISELEELYKILGYGKNKDQVQNNFYNNERSLVLLFRFYC